MSWKGFGSKDATNSCFFIWSAIFCARLLKEASILPENSRPAEARSTMGSNAVLCASLQVSANKIKICESFFGAYRSERRQQPCSAHYVEVPEAPGCVYPQHHSMCDLLCRACRELPGRALKGTAVVPAKYPEATWVWAVVPRSTAP